MSITAPEQGDPTRLALLLAILDELESLHSDLGAGGGQGTLPNGSFEADGDSDGQPDGWTFTAYPGGSGALDDTSAIHGTRAFKFTSPGGTGNGGGYLETTDPIAVSPNRRFRVSWELKSSAAEIKNRVEVRWYAGAAEADYLSTTALWQEDTNNPDDWCYQTAQAYPPAAARYAKLRLVGGDPSDDTAGEVWFDHLRLESGSRLPMVERYLTGTPGGTLQTDSGFQAQGYEFTWICPLDVTEICVRLWGGGGRGGAASAGNYGGGGGVYAEARIAVKPGQAYTVRVGKGGVFTTYINGGVSQFMDGAAVLAKAGGGINGTSTGMGAGGTANVGDVSILGQNGEGYNYGGNGGASGLGGAGGVISGQAGVFPGGGGAFGNGLGADGMVEIAY